MHRHLLPRSEMVGLEAIRANARVVRALGMHSIRQTFRRPQLMAPIVVFPTLLLAIQTVRAIHERVTADSARAFVPSRR